MARVNDARDLGAFIPAALDDYPLTAEEFRIYCRTVRRAGTTEGCFESHTTVSKATGIGSRLVSDARALLVAAGLLRIEGGRADCKPTGRPNVYHLTHQSEWVDPSELPRLRNEVRRPSHRRASDTPTSGQSDQGSQRPVVSVTGGGVVEEGGGGVVESADEGTTTKAIPLRGTDAPAANQGRQDDFGGFPFTRAEGKSYARTVSAWLREQGVQFPAARFRNQGYRLVLEQIDAMLPASERRKTGCAIGVVCDYVADVCDRSLDDPARAHLGTLVKTFGAVPAFDAISEAAERGVGIDGEHANDPRALTKYARSLLNKKREDAA